MSKVNILPGSDILPPGKYKYEGGCLFGKKAYTALDAFLVDVKKLDKDIDGEEIKNCLIKGGVAAAGMVLFGPFGLLAGIFAGNSKKVLLKISLNFGAPAPTAEFMMEADFETYSKLLEVVKKNETP